MKLVDGNTGPRQYLLASDFDQTLSFNDSGILLSEMLGLSGFAEKCAGLSSMHLVHQGAELSYLLLHDPEYRRVRRADLEEVGRRIRLKQNIDALGRVLRSLQGVQFTFNVISAAPEVPPERIHGTRFRYDPDSGEIQSIVRVPAGVLSILVPVLEDIVGLDVAGIRAFFGGHGFVLQDWDKTRTDSLIIRGASNQTTAVA
jgi:hypothetical protein